MSGVLAAWLLVAVLQGAATEPPVVVGRFVSQTACAAEIPHVQRSGLYPRHALVCVIAPGTLG